MTRADQPVGSTRAGGGAVIRGAPLKARRALLWAVGGLCVSCALGPALARANGSPFIAGFSPTTIATTQPPNLDQNPYGIVTVPSSVGSLHRGDVLVSNFNNAANTQGTGTTIVEIPPGGNSQSPGTATVFAQIDPSNLPGPCPGGVGLTTALGVTSSGFVVVGSLPTTDSQLDTAGAGCLLVLNSQGKVVQTIAGGPINGPWDMTLVDHGLFATLYVSNVENGDVATSPKPVDKGTVVRMQLLTTPGIKARSIRRGCDREGLPRAGELHRGRARTDWSGAVAQRNAVRGRHPGQPDRAIPDASFRQSPIGGGGITVTSGGALNGPLGMTLAPNGDILTSNGGDGLVVETTPGGQQVANVDTGFSGGSLFGLTVPPSGDKVYLVDDGNNTLAVLH